MTRTLFALVVAAGLGLAPRLADAHISIASGPGFANTTQEIAFGVGHGCAGADTYKVRIEIPSTVTSVRPVRSDFGKVSVEKDAAGTITAAVWQKADADALDADIAYYKLVLRLKVPNQPFTTIFFKAHQTCRAADGTLSTTDWVMLPTDPVVDGGTDEPAPSLTIVPARLSGWNKVHRRRRGRGPRRVLLRRADRVEGNRRVQREPDDEGPDQHDVRRHAALVARRERRDLGAVLMRSMLVRGLSLAAALAAWSCGGSNGRAPTGAGGIGGVGGVGNMSGGGGSTTRAACVDRPDDLMRPPSGGLPCALIPPGVQL
jgi:uncharacterized protein YcnI